MRLHANREHSPQAVFPAELGIVGCWLGHLSFQKAVSCQHSKRKLQWDTCLVTCRALQLSALATASSI